MSRIVPIWKRCFFEWTKETSIIPYRYLSDRKLTVFERVWWAAGIIVTLITCCYSAFTLYKKWCDNPVVIGYATKLSPVSTIPFPAVTICPLTKTRVEAFNITEVHGIISRGEALDEVREKQRQVLAHVCPWSSHWKHPGKPVPVDSVVNTLRNMSLSFNETMLMCFWRLQETSCRTLFSDILADDGICYTFNNLLPNETYRMNAISQDFTNFATAAVRSSWSLDSEYDKQAGINAFPHRGLSNGLISGLIVLPMSRKIDQDFLCRGPYTGYKFSVHTPGEIPLTNDKFYRLNALNSVTLSVTPRVIRTSRQLRSLAPLRRGCFFNNERHLKFYRTYTMSNCVLECVANVTLEKCHCVKFSMPRSDDTKVCDTSQIECYSNIYLDLLTRKVMNALSGRMENNCNCLPPCNSLEFDVEVSEFPFNFHEMATAMRMPAMNYGQVDSAALFIKLKNRHYLPMWRREMMGHTDVLAKIGGIFALLMGASVLSLAEIVYYCCVRPLRRERVQHSPINLY
ncbi:pickpocket protein 28-like [Armigeres subalbatus]|uniref:pickpocket protein 28-like n=1 Tax=Armigeres subalbatus TaxID=124917 RepID=UPI002ED11800